MSQPTMYILSCPSHSPICMDAYTVERPTYIPSRKFILNPWPGMLVSTMLFCLNFLMILVLNNMPSVNSSQYFAQRSLILSSQNVQYLVGHTLSSGLFIDIRSMICELLSFGRSISPCDGPLPIITSILPAPVLRNLSMAVGAGGGGSYCSALTLSTMLGTCLVRFGCAAMTFRMLTACGVALGIGLQRIDCTSAFVARLMGLIGMFGMYGTNSCLYDFYASGVWEWGFINYSFCKFGFISGLSNFFAFNCIHDSGYCCCDQIENRSSSRSIFEFTAQYLRKGVH